MTSPNTLPPLPPGFAIDPEPPIAAPAAGGAATGALPALPAGFVVDAGPAPAFVPPAPPPGAIVHGGDGRSFIADDPAIAVRRDQPAGSREEAIQMQALRARGAAEGPVQAAARAVQPFTQGQTLGGGDELISAILAGGAAATGGSFSDTFEYGQEFQRQELDRRRTEAPTATTLLELLGGVSTGYGLAKNGATLAGRIPRAVGAGVGRSAGNLAVRSAAGAAEGAAYGGVAGFAGARGDAGERVDDAATGAAIGGALGGVAVPVIDAVSAVMRPAIGNAVNSFINPDGQARRIVGEALRRDRITPDQAADAVEAARAAGQPGFALADSAGRNARRKVAMAAKTPGEFRETAARTVAARQDAQGERIGGYVDEALGDGGAAFGTEEALRQSRRQSSQALYDEAYREPTPSGAVYDEMLNRQSVKDALRAAERTAAERQIPVSELFTEVPNPNAVTRRVPTYTVDAAGQPAYRTEVDNPTLRVPTVRGWDFVKRELDARVNQLYTAGDTTAAEAIKETRNALRAQLGQDNPAYGRALAQYADDSSALDAVQTGRDFVRASNPDAARSAYDALSPGNRDFARIGASREIGVKADRMTTNQDKTRIFDTPAMRAKLDVLIDDPAVRGVFNARLERERAMIRTNREIQGGSNTAENLTDAADNAGGLVRATGSALTGNLVGAAREVFGAVGRYGSGMSEDVAQRVGSFLMSADPAEIRALNEAFNAATSNAGRARIASSVVAGVSALTDNATPQGARSAPHQLQPAGRAVSMGDPLLDLLEQGRRQRQEATWPAISPELLQAIVNGGAMTAGAR